MRAFNIGRLLRCLVSITPALDTIASSASTDSGGSSSTSASSILPSPPVGGSPEFAA
jgi:hypothetical protein